MSIIEKHSWRYVEGNFSQSRNYLSSFFLRMWHCFDICSVHLNLTSNLPDGRKMLTFIRPGTKPGLLLHMVQDLPFKHESAKYLPLSRVQIFSAKDDSISLNIFVYGEGKNSPKFNPSVAGARILNYARNLRSQNVTTNNKQPSPNPLFENQSLIDYMSKCSETFVMRSDPQRFLNLLQLYDSVSGTEGTNVSIDVSLYFSISYPYESFLSYSFPSTNDFSIVAHIPTQG